MNATLISWIRGTFRSPVLRSWIRIYVCTSVATYFLILLLLGIHPGVGRIFAAGPGCFLMLPVLYFALWLGPIDLMFAHPGTLMSGVWFLVIAVVLAVFGFRVRKSSARTLLFSLSAIVWFAATFSVFLSESV